MVITFNSDISKFLILSTKGECLASVPNAVIADMLKKMYEELEDEYFNRVDYQDNSRWLGDRYL